MGDNDEKRDSSKGSRAAGAAGTVAAAGAAVAGAQSFLFGDEAEALDLDTPIDRVAPAVDLGAHAIEADDEFDDDALADDVDALLLDDPLLGTADVLGHDEADLTGGLDGLDDPLDEDDDLGLGPLDDGIDGIGDAPDDGLGDPNEGHEGDGGDGSFDLG